MEVVHRYDGRPCPTMPRLAGAWAGKRFRRRATTASLETSYCASLVATNPHASFPAADGLDWPRAGALLAAIETTTGVRGDVIGKPHPPLLRAAHERAGGGRPLVIGDRLDTDIAGAAGLGWDSLLVLTGISTRDDVASSPLRPTYVAEDLRALFAADE